MIFLKQSTAANFYLGVFVDPTDGNTPVTDLTIANTDIKLFKAGAETRLNKNSGGATHLATGSYYMTLDTTDTNTLGPLWITIHKTGALLKEFECVVLTANAYDMLCNTGNFAGTVADVTALPTLAEILAGSVEGSYTVVQALRAMLALFGGEITGLTAGAGSATIRDISDSKNRAVATIDADGNRTAVASIDLS